MAKVQNDMMDKLVALCKGRGFVFPGSAIYGGLANSWDYGPLGVEFKNNVKRAWWKDVYKRQSYTIPAGTYAGQEEDVPTSAVKLTLFITADMDEETVYQMTKTCLLYTSRCV